MAGFAWTLDISAPEGKDKAEFVDELIAMLNFRGCTVNGQLSSVRGVKTNKASLKYLESQKPLSALWWGTK